MAIFKSIHGMMAKRGVTLYYVYGNDGRQIPRLSFRHIEALTGAEKAFFRKNRAEVIKLLELDAEAYEKSATLSKDLRKMLYGYPY